MSRIDEVFARRRAAGQKVLVAYLCVGDPSVEASIGAARAALAAGADVLELGVAFSDPTADGPSIARASERAIAAGATLKKTIDAAAAVRRSTDAPIILFGYYNPIYVRGERKVVREAAEAGIDGLLVVDLPPEEGEELRDEAARAQVAIIPLLTPTSGAERVSAAIARASGFVYYVSVTGVTGAVAETALAEASQQAARLRDVAKLPVVVGFGVDGPAKARLAAGADGVVVGTAVVKAIEAGADQAAREAGVAKLISSIRQGLDGG
jgi:tryptophan synthase alpha chain